MSQTPRIIHLPKVRMLSRGGRPSSIKITNVKSIRPPDPALVKKQEEERLRAQLEKEIALRGRTCAHAAYECTLPVVSGRSYCARHILDDKTAPYKQCVHVAQNGVRCSLPAPAEKEQGLCFEHARAALYARQRSAAPPPPVTTSETLLNQLQHYVRPERTRTTSCASAVSVVSEPGDIDQATPLAIDPFKDIDGRAVNAQVSSSLMECGSGSDSDADDAVAGHPDLPLSDTEDAPAEDMPLWRAGVYTAEEAVSETKTVLKTLREAYIQQMKRLRVMLQTARLEYVRSLRAEKEQYCSINSQARSGVTVRERRQLRQLKAYAGYRRAAGRAAVMARQLHKRRARVREHPRGAPQPRCRFAEGGVRCDTNALPAARYCLKHILNDPHQVLFKMCGDTRGVARCREVVARGPLPSAACRYHTGVPTYTPFTLKKDESDSDSESRSSEVSHPEELPELEFKTSEDVVEETVVTEPIQYD
ncbi:KAT8 regulatory NSL complex subunit 2 [Aricia agestis]|uniref:KAT8 regulatory NSL complex subunit 2 n=1 Tax=Aricia agestis TaxID=91739 RepID=UPI001C205A06|nr:KAT8 regulatory NSL complex subunit 2 [Aricia agestis]